MMVLQSIYNINLNLKKIQNNIIKYKKDSNNDIFIYFINKYSKINI